MDKSKSLSIIRSYLRYAISSIVYYKFSSNRLNDNRCSDVKEEGTYRQSQQSYKEKQKSCDNYDMNEMTCDRFQNCFITKRFCGLDDLKFIDVVDDNQFIKNENIFKITKWLEVSVFPLIEKDMLKSMNFVILSIPLYKRQQCHEATLDIFKFDFKLENKMDVATKLSDQIRTALTSIIELLRSKCECYNTDGNEKLIHNQSRSDSHRHLKISMNFILEHDQYVDSIKREGAKFVNSCVNNAASQKDNEHDCLFQNFQSPTNNPLQDLIKNVLDQKDNDAKQYQTNIAEYDDHQIEIYLESSNNNYNILDQLSQEDEGVLSSSSSSVRTFQSKSSNQRFIDENNDNDGYSFQALHNIQSSYHCVKSYHKQMKIDNVRSIEIFEHLFGQQPSRYYEVELDDFVQASDNNLNQNNKRGRGSGSKPHVLLRRSRSRKNDPIPPTLTPMRPSYTPSPPLCLHQTKAKGTINNTFASRDQSFSVDKIQSFVTPNQVKRKNQFAASSEAPTIVVRLSSCLDSNSPMFSSVTPHNTG